MSDARQKEKRLERVLKVQAQKRQIEEWLLSHLKQKHAQIADADRAILESLDPTSDLHGLFVDAKVKSLRRNDTARRENEARQRENEARLANARRREKGIERKLEEAGKTSRSEEDAGELDGHVESFLARLSNSLG